VSAGTAHDRDGPSPLRPRRGAYLDRKLAEGKSAAEARRCLKRHLANVVYRALIADTNSLALT
jgi:hypothetical protein